MSVIVLSALVLLPGSVSAQAASDPAVTYQENPAHDGHQANDTLTPPLAQRWSRTFSGHVSYALIANGEVFVMVGHPNVYVTSSTYTLGVSVHAFSQSTGTELWSYDMPATGIYASNFGAAAYDNGQVFAVNADGTMDAFNASTGHLNWTQTGLGTGIPVAVNGVVYEGSTTGGRQGAQALSEADGHMIWSYNNLSTSGQNPTVTSGGVYLTDWCQNNYDLASSDGHLVWTTTPTGCTTGGYNVSPVYSGRLYSRSPAGHNQVYDASNGAPLGTYRSDLNEAFDGSLGFLSYGTQLRAVDLTTGAVLWRFNGDCDLLSSPVVANGYVYIGSTQGHIYALSERTGSPAWSDSIGSPIGPHQDWSPDGPPFGLNVGEGLLAVAALDKLVLYAPGTALSPAPPILDTEAVSHYGTSGQVFWITRGPDNNLWATEFYDNKIARITTGGAVTEFNIPTGSSHPVHIVSGPDGALWFTELAGNKVGRITASGSFSEYPLTAYTQPYGITVGPDNNLWITESGFGQIVQMHTDGSLGTTVTLPGATPSDSRSPHGITTGPDGNLWVTEAAPGRAIIARITPAGSVTEFPLPKTIETDYAQPEDIVTGPDGNLWFTIPGDVGYPGGHYPVRHAELGRITTTGSISYFIAPTPWSSPYGLTVGPDGALWFTEAEHGDNTPAKIGRMTTSGEAREYWDTGYYPKPRGIANGPDGNLWFGDALPAVGRVVPALGGCPVSSGQLRATTSPAVPSQIMVDGTAMDSWGLNWVDLSPGSHTVSYTHVQGFTEPPPQIVDVFPGAITTTTGNFVQRGWLQVTTSPAVPAPIYVDGTVRDDWGLWTDLPTGPHQVCFGPVADYTPPPCQSVTLTTGATTSVMGSYTSSPGQPGPVGTVKLRVTTNPPLPSQILVNGVPMDTWGLNWVDLPPGRYTISFTHVEGYTDPAPYSLSLYSGVENVTGNFKQNGSLRVVTSPPEPAAISVDDLVRDDWGMWTDLPVGSHIVCFGSVPGTLAPPCQTVTLSAGALSTVTGTYAPGARRRA